MRIILPGLALLVVGMAAPARAQLITIQFGTPCAPASRHAAPTCGYAPPPMISYGYWTLQKQRVYVPGQWTWWQHPCGAYQKRWIPAGYRYVSQRVWVPCAQPPPSMVCRR